MSSVCNPFIRKNHPDQVSRLSKNVEKQRTKKAFVRPLISCAAVPEEMRRSYKPFRLGPFVK
jgi:hypothetical protein